MREVKIDSMDCHADKSARNDRKKASFPPQDFFYTTAKDSKICDEKAGLRRIFCGDKPWVAIAQEKSKLPALSRKAESTSEKLTKEKTKCLERKSIALNCS